MRRGGLAQVLQHASDSSLFSKGNLYSPPRSVSWSQRKHYNNRNNSDHFSVSILCGSSSSVANWFSSRSGSALDFAGLQIGKSSCWGCTQSTNSDLRSIGSGRLPKALFSRSSKSRLHSSGVLGGPHEQGDRRGVESATMAALAEKTSGSGAAAPQGYRPNVGLCLVNEKDEVIAS
jgi:hypothetical protein